MTIEDVTINIAGLGIIMYSPFAVANISLGEDYLTNHYWEKEAVAEQVNQGKIVGFSTGSPGTYIMRFKKGVPTNKQIKQSEFRLRLGIEVRDEALVIDDLYSLLAWDNCCETSIQLKNGFYCLSLLGNRPVSKILGDNQCIDCYCNKLDSMPALFHQGVPSFSY